MAGGAAGAAANDAAAASARSAAPIRHERDGLADITERRVLAGQFHVVVGGFP